MLFCICFFHIPVVANRCGLSQSLCIWHMYVRHRQPPAQTTAKLQPGETQHGCANIDLLKLPVLRLSCENQMSHLSDKVLLRVNSLSVHILGVANINQLVTPKHHTHTIGLCRHVDVSPCSSNHVVVICCVHGFMAWRR